MLFPTIEFAVFFALVLPASWLLMPHRFRWRVFIVAASFVFYGAWSWNYVLLLAASIVGNQTVAVAIARAGDRAARQRRIALAVAANLGVLGWYKYSGFFAETGGSLLESLGFEVTLPAPDVVLPIGISFFTFQALSYVIDVGREKVTPTTLLDFAVYLSFFPHLVAGPIVRASEFLPQLRFRRDPRHVDASLALWLIAGGLFKKVVIASYLADRAVDPLFAFPQQHGGVEALIGVYAYAIQIYADFSGYTDIAIGLALLLGFRFPQNFDAPYAAVSLQDFWRRWHMTLSRWLRDYVYIPLGGSHRGRVRTYFNLMITMLLGGLWHGAAWTFVVWGGLHGTGLAVEQWRSERRRAREAAALVASTGDVQSPNVRSSGADPPNVRSSGAESVTNDRTFDGGAEGDGGARGGGGLPRWVRVAITFNLVCLGWIFFRSESLTAAFDVIGRIIGGEASVAVNPVVVAVIALALAAQFVPAATVGRWRVAFSRWSATAQALALASVLLLIDVLGPTGIAPFIYFQF